MSRGKDFNLDLAKEFSYRMQKHESEKEEIDILKLY